MAGGERGYCSSAATYGGAIAVAACHRLFAALSARLSRRASTLLPGVTKPPGQFAPLTRVDPRTTILSQSITRSSSPSSLPPLDGRDAMVTARSLRSPRTCLFEAD
ncbi:hypothetical protein MRX96_003970 [Rhipicephalus microplus]